MRRKQKLIALLTVAALTATVLVSYFALSLFMRHPVVIFERESRNVLLADGKPVMWFQEINPYDSTLTGLSLCRDSVKASMPITVDSATISYCVDQSYLKMIRKMEILDAEFAELTYFLNTNADQDEGFDMALTRWEEVKNDKMALMMMLDRLNEIDSQSRFSVRREVLLDTFRTSDNKRLAIISGNGVWNPVPQWHTELNGKGLTQGPDNAIIIGQWYADRLVSGQSTDHAGVYRGTLNSHGLRNGYGKFLTFDGTYHEGHWANSSPDGFGMAFEESMFRVGHWREGIYKGQKMTYTQDKIYGIDVSRYQHEQGRRTYPINWNRLRIKNLGKKANKMVKGEIDYPVSFAFIKSTEGVTVRNRWFKQDYYAARRAGIRTGAYHFFSTKQPGREQAEFFLKNTRFNTGDLPPVLDIEPSDTQIEAMGGGEAMWREVRDWINIVERATGTEPILYVSQSFRKRWFNLVPDIRDSYPVWIARYSEYKPDAHLVMWQLSPDGKVQGIHGDVDIDVFNGYERKFQEFIANSCIK